MKRKRKRNMKRNEKKTVKFRMFGANAAGVKCKLKSLDDILKRLQPQIWAIQETKLKPNERLKLEVGNDFQIYYLYRQNSQGGGLAVGVHKDIESALVGEGNDDIEALVVQAVLGSIPVKIVVAYGPQENAKKEKKEKFWNFIEDEVKS